jgi:hypothetical protein
MEFYLLESIKHKFIEKCIFPLYEPAIEYFSQYGITASTVRNVPNLIILIIFAITYEDKKSYFFKVMLVTIGFGVLAIIQGQWW